MSFIIFSSLLIGGSFVRADLSGTVKGGVGLITIDASIGFDKVAEAKIAFSKALNKTTNCGSGPDSALPGVEKGYNKLSKVLSDLGVAITNNTDDNGQLKLGEGGDISQITDQIHNAAKALVSLSKDIQNLTDNIETESFAHIDKLLDSLYEVIESTYDFYYAFNRLELVYSKLLLQLISVPTLFTDSIHNLAKSVQVEMKATEAFEQRCNVSNGVREALSKYHDVVYAVYETLMLAQ